jgi:hypothetical protein
MKKKSSNIHIEIMRDLPFSMQGNRYCISCPLRLCGCVIISGTSERSPYYFRTFTASPSLNMPLGPKCLTLNERWTRDFERIMNKYKKPNWKPKVKHEF